MSKKRVIFEVAIFSCIMFVIIKFGFSLFLSCKPNFKMIIASFLIVLAAILLFIVMKRICILLTLLFGKLVSCKCVDVKKEMSDHEVGMGRTPEYLSIEYEINSSLKKRGSISYNNLTKTIQPGKTIPIRCLGKMNYIDYDCLIRNLRNR